MNRLHPNAPSFSTWSSRLSTLCKAHSWLFLPHMSLVAYPWSFANTPSSPSHSSCHDTNWDGRLMLWLVYLVNVWVKRSSLFVFEAFYEIYLIRWTSKIFKSKLLCQVFVFRRCSHVSFHFSACGCRFRPALDSSMFLFEEQKHSEVSLQALAQLAKTTLEQLQRFQCLSFCDYTFKSSVSN